MKYNSLIQEAQRILQSNWKGGFTIPRANLYPFQWNWDSGFTCLGHGYYHLDRAILELTSLFSSQWQNGMLPHIVFHSEDETTYFPNYDFWNTAVHPGAPQQPKSSGITQPPVHGFILSSLLERYPDDDRLLLLARELYPKIVKYHRFLYTYRDPEREGLMFIYHPWESGRDNSPLWDASLDRIVVDKSALPNYERKDLSHAAADQRPTTDHYDRYVYLLELGKKYKYDEQGIYEESPLVIQDTLMNAALIWSNEGLLKIAERLKEDSAEIVEWQSQSIQTFRQKCWNQDLKTFVPYDVRSSSQIVQKEIGGITALCGDIADEAQADCINEYLQGLHQRGYYLCPSFDVDSALFDSKRYWRGPIWPQMNWMIYHGLKKYGYQETAGIVRQDLLELVATLGFYEYFESQKSIATSLKIGYGGSDFSWTAACILDFIKSE